MGKARPMHCHALWGHTQQLQVFLVVETLCARQTKEVAQLPVRCVTKTVTRKAVPRMFTH